MRDRSRHPVHQTAVRIVDGEILVAGPHVNPGYLDPSQDEATKVRDGDTTWHRTGDAGHLDADGRLWLLGRHAARVGALYPFQAEAAAHAWPGVRRAALVEVAGAPALALVGTPDRFDEWRRLAGALGVRQIAIASALPMDRRHRSKVDRTALKGTRLVGQSSESYGYADEALAAAKRLAHWRAGIMVLAREIDDEGIPRGLPAVLAIHGTVPEGWLSAGRATA